MGAAVVVVPCVTPLGQIQFRPSYQVDSLQAYRRIEQPINTDLKDASRR